MSNYPACLQIFFQVEIGLQFKALRIVFVFHKILQGRLVLACVLIQKSTDFSISMFTKLQSALDVRTAVCILLMLT